MYLYKKEDFNMNRTMCKILAALFGAMFILTLILVLTVDVRAIGPKGTSIGLSTLNEEFHELTGENMFWYKITEFLGIFSLAVAGFVAAMGLYQLITRKSIKKVDREIITAGILYVVMFLLYIFFDKVVINYRPVIMSGETEVEPSFPSSHTMLVIVVLGSAILLILSYIKDIKIKSSAISVLLILTAITVIGRLVCGVHWMSDIFAGVFLSLALLSLYAAYMKE
jgi:undecaprenyl-diphosphatase